MEKGRLLKEMREKCRYTQAELADKMGLSQKTISSWEKGRTYPRFKQVCWLSEIFGCSVEELTGTYAQKIQNITLEDIYSIIPTLEINEMTDLITYASKVKEEKIEIEEMKKEKAMLEARLAKYEQLLAERGIKDES